jgi:hypothetical protein
MRRAVAVLALALLAGGTCPTQGSAQEDGVYFDDPDSPGGKEYSIPHERTRRENGGGGGDPGSRGETPRFGVGIDSDEGDSAGGAGGSSGGDGGSAGGGESEGANRGGDESGGANSGGGKSGDGASRSGGATAGGGSAGSSGSQSGEVTYRSTSSSGTSPELTVSAIALGVLLAGAALGLVLRRSRRDPAG